MVEPHAFARGEQPAKLLTATGYSPSSVALTDPPGFDQQWAGGKPGPFRMGGTASGTCPSFWLGLPK